MATGTFSPRYMRLWFPDRALRGVLAVTVGTVTFAFSLLRKVEEDSVPDLAVTFAGLLLGVALVLFLVFFDRVLHRMRPVKVAALVAAAGRTTMRRMAGGAEASPGAEEPSLAFAPALVVRSPHPGAIQAVDHRGLVRWAGETGCVVVAAHAVGDFVSSGGIIFEIHGTLSDPGRAERRLRGMVALGLERTLEQDPAFAVRILVDIAVRALSPAVNDPTTAVQVIDHLEDVLAEIGRTPGLGRSWEYRDDAGALRMVIPGQRWDDLLALGITEIREYGAPSIQVARRLRATWRRSTRACSPSTRARSRASWRASIGRWRRASGRRPTPTERGCRTARASAGRRSGSPERLRPRRVDRAGRARTAARGRGPPGPAPPRTPSPPTRGWRRPRRPR